MLLDRGLRRRFDPHVEREARAAAERPPEDEAAGRLDLRALPTFTIDPPTARDFDDAISAEALEDGAVRVWVHIADVSHYVKPGSPVDREAFRRATSVYVPGTVEPMLPEVLSNGACSLVPHQDRLAVTVELEFDGREGAPHRLPPHDHPLRRAAGLPAGGPDLRRRRSAAQAPWAEPLAAARRVAAALQEAREARGALAVESEEPEFAFSREGHVTELAWSEQTESHRLIEHLMIAANEAVATLLETRKLPALYRVHERPEPARVERLVDQLASLDVPTPPLPDPMTPQQAADAVAEIAHLVDREVRRRGHGRAALTSLVLRSLKQAHYSPKNVGHAGLRSPRYCHFTSPIRRYPDLICHRALLAAIGAGEDAAARLGHGGARGSGARCASATRWRSSAAATRSRAASCSRPSCSSRGWHTEFEGEVAGVIGAGRVRGLRRASRACCPCAACAATGGSSTSSRRCSSARSRATRCGSATRSSCRSSASTRRAAAWTSRPSRCRWRPATEVPASGAAGSPSGTPGCPSRTPPSLKAQALR